LQWFNKNYNFDIKKEMQTGSYNISLSYNQIRELVHQLPKKDKARLGQELAKEATDQRLSRLLNSFRTDELTQDDIDKEVESVRAELYAKKKKD
jgi:hypothetical protein